MILLEITTSLTRQQTFKYQKCFIQVPFACGEMLVGLIAYYVQHWQTLQQVTSGIVLGMIFTI